MKKTFLYIGILAVLLLVSACSLQPAANAPADDVPDNALPADEDTTNSADQPAESVFGEGGFTLDLPEGWDVFGPDTIEDEAGRSYQIYLIAPDQGYLEGPGASKVIIASTAEWSTMDLIQNQCSTCPDNGYEVIMLGNTSALKTEIGGGGVPFTVTWYFVEHGGNLIGISIHDPETLEPLTDVVESIQFQ